MAGEFQLINPRRRSRKRAKATTRRRRRARAHHNPLNRRRRRVARAMTHHRRRRRIHRNPRGMFGGIDLGAAAITTGGLVGTNVAAGYLSKMLPAGWQTPIARIGVKAAIGIGAPMLLRRFIGGRTAGLIATGAAISVLLDAFNTWVAPSIGLSDYEVGMTGYEANPMLSGGDEMALQGGIYDSGIY